MKKILSFLFIFLLITFIYITGSKAETLCTDANVKAYYSGEISTINSEIKNMCIYQDFDDPISGSRKHIQIMRQDDGENTAFFYFLVSENGKSGSKETNPKLLLCLNGNSEQPTESITPCYEDEDGETICNKYYNEGSGSPKEGTKVAADIPGYNSLKFGKCPYSAGIYRPNSNSNQYELIYYMENKSEGGFHGSVLGSNEYQDGSFVNSKYVYQYKEQKNNDGNQTETQFLTSKNFCENDGSLKVLKILREVIHIIKICIPIVLIILGSIEFGKAVASKDDDAVGKTFKNLMVKVGIGVAIFFVPVIVDSIVNNVNKYDALKNTFVNCQVCFFGDENHSYDTCNTVIKAAENKCYAEGINQVLKDKCSSEFGIVYSNETED